MLRILKYHRIASPDTSPHLDPALVSATPESFRNQMEHLAGRYAPVSLRQVVEAFTGGAPLPRGAVHVTFDHGYRDFGETAWPILRELGIPVTLFVPTAYPGCAGREFWWDRVRRAMVAGRLAHAGPSPGTLALAPDRPLHGPAAIGSARELLEDLPHDEAEELADRICAAAAVPRAPEDRRVLSWHELRVLGREGVTFGSHTHHHVSLPAVGEARRRWEIRRSLDDLHRDLHMEDAALSYPYGAVDDDVIRVAREEGCVLGFTGQEGVNRPGTTDPMRLMRIPITPATGAVLFPIRLLPWPGLALPWGSRKRRWVA
jgi:peptidoglycan/xylan/chitin deacetylase (PgdA/CDA1 family)